MRVVFQYLLVLCLFCLCILPSNAKNLKLFKKFPFDNPLSYQSVRTIAQDGDGFIWLGTHEGLHRFDGYQLQSFHHDSEIGSSLSTDTISVLLVDRQGQLWVGTRGGGVNLYRQDNHSFEHFRAAESAQGLTSDNINALLEDSQGNIWAATENGLNIISRQPEGYSAKRIDNYSGPNQQDTQSGFEIIIETQQRQVWAATDSSGIRVFDLDGNFIRTLAFGQSNIPTSNDRITALYPDHQGYVWIGSYSGKLVRYDPFSDQYEDFSDATARLNNNHIIKALFEDSEHTLWVATDKGLMLFDSQSGQFELYQHQAENPYSLSNDITLTVFEDQEGIVWIGTFSGVNRWDPAVATFSQHNTQLSPNLNNNVITSFAEGDNGDMYIGTYGGGINLLDTATDGISQPEFNDFFANLRIMSLLADNDTLWVGTRSSGLYEVDLTRGEIRTFKHDKHAPESISANSITGILKDQRGQIWVSTYEAGLNKYLGNGAFQRFVHDPQQPHSGPNTDHILQMVESQTGVIWLSTYGGGINRFDTKTEEFEYYVHDNKNNQSISSDLAWTLFLDSRDRLWVGTQSAGLNYLENASGATQDFVFERLNIRDGLKSRTVYAISEDDDGFIWFTSNKGISRYSPDTASFKHFDTAHGLLDLEHNHAAIYHSNQNTLYFGNAKGFSSINPEKVLSNQQAPEVRLTNIYRLNEAMKMDRALSEIDKLTFGYEDQLIAFEYTGLNYAAPESTRYKYRLLGFDQSWVDAGTLRRATYTNLPAGQYQLQIIAGNNDNIWSSPGLSLDIEITPAPWNTWWAYLSYTGIIAGLLLMYARFLSRKLVIEQQQSEQLKRQVEEKTQKFQQKNVELEKANRLLEQAATVDKLTQVKSRRYLDIYIQQASDLMAQIHQSISPVNMYALPRLYLLLIQFDQDTKPDNSQVLNLAELLVHSCNEGDHVIRWSENTFAMLGHEKDDNTRHLVGKLQQRFASVFTHIDINMAYTFYPFDVENPDNLSWDKTSVIAEIGLKVLKQSELRWVGIYKPASHPFDYREFIKQSSMQALDKLAKTRRG